MSGAQHAVLWMGFLLIVVKLLTTSQWSELWVTLKNGGGAFPGGGSPSGSQPANAPNVPNPSNPRKEANPGAPISLWPHRM